MTHNCNVIPWSVYLDGDYKVFGKQSSLKFEFQVQQ